MKQLKEVAKKLTNAEVAESYVFPMTLSEKEEAESQKQLARLRKKRELAQTHEEKQLLSFLQLKYMMLDYVEGDRYDNRLTLGYFLREYIHILGAKNKDFAEDVGVTPTELSHFLSGRRVPGEDFLVRLEIHSNKSIPALYWLKVLEKGKEHEVANNIQLRRREQKMVKRKLAFSF